MEGYSTYGWPEDLRKQYEAEWEKDHPLPAPFASKLTEEVETFIPPPGYSDVVDHEANFFNAVRSSQAVRRERGVRQQCGHRLPSRELLVLQQADRDVGCVRQEDHELIELAGRVSFGYRGKIDLEGHAFELPEWSNGSGTRLRTASASDSLHARQFSLQLHETQARPRPGITMIAWPQKRLARRLIRYANAAQW